VSPASADLTHDPAGRSRKAGCARCGAPVGLWSGLGGLTSRRRCQIHTGRSTKGRLICHASFQSLAVLALALAMVEAPLAAETLLIAAVGLAALETAGFLAATEAAVTLAAVTVAAEIKHRAARRKVTHTLAKDCGTSNWHRFREGALDNRRRSWQDGSRY